MKVLVEKLSHFDDSFPLPQYETPGAAGADIRVSLEGKGKLVIAPFDRVLLPTGLKFQIPVGYEIQVRPRSGLSLKTTLSISNSPGTVDSDYRGELKILVANIGTKEIEIEHGLRVAQLVLSPVLQADYQWTQSVSTTRRGDGGFGSTGLN